MCPRVERRVASKDTRAAGGELQFAIVRLARIGLGGEGGAALYSLPRTQTAGRESVGLWPSQETHAVHGGQA
jgi:hypothetical protein